MRHVRVGEDDDQAAGVEEALGLVAPAAQQVGEADRLGGRGAVEDGLVVVGGEALARA